jgi:hypothetical protein
MRLSAAVLTLVLCGVAGSITNAQQLPTDFAVRYEVGDCRAERFDSSIGAYVRPLFVESGPQPLTARIVLSDFQMQTIYKMIEDIGFFKYPAQLKAVPPDALETITTSPSSTYRLEVRSRGVTHAVSWTDAYKPTTPEWDRLHALGRTIIGYVHDHLEFKRLRPHFPCE